MVSRLFCGVFLLSLAACMHSRAAEPTEGQRVYESFQKIFEGKFHKIHGPVPIHDVAAAPPQTQPSAIPGEKGAAVTQPADGGPIALDVNGFGLSLPRSVEEVAITSIRESTPFRIDVVSAGGKSVWTVPGSLPPVAKLSSGVRPQGRTIPLYVGVDFDRGATPIGLPLDARQVSFRLAKPLSANRPNGPNRVEIYLHDWDISISLLGVSAGGYFDPWKAYLFLLSRDEISPLVDPLVKASESENQVLASFDKMRKELLKLPDEELFLQSIAADKADLRRQSTLEGAVHEGALQFLSDGLVSDTLGVYRIKVNGQRVYVFASSPADSEYQVRAYNNDGSFAWDAMIDSRIFGAVGSARWPGAPAERIVAQLSRMLDAPGHANVNPYIKKTTP